MPLRKVKKILETNTNKKSFFEVVSKRFPKCSSEYSLIEKAYKTAKEAFKGKVREGTGKRYFEHVRGVALIDMVYLRITNANIIAAALLHDILEDIEGWTYDKLVLEFNVEVANMVWWVSKLPVSEFDGDKTVRNRRFHLRLYEAPRKAIFIKLADRLHNLLDMWGLPEEKVLRKITETEDFYISLAEKHILLIHELEAALDELKKV